MIMFVFCCVFPQMVSVDEEIEMDVNSTSNCLNFQVMNGMISCLACTGAISLKRESLSFVVQ